MAETRYQLAPGLEIVSSGAARYTLRSDFVAVVLSGETAVDLVEKVLSRLDRPRTLEEICALLPGYHPESLRQRVESLLREGILIVTTTPLEAPANPAFAVLLDQLGVGAEATAKRLAERRVAVLGLEAHGAHVAHLLADMGVGALTLVDPFPFEQAHLALTPVRKPEAVGWSRQVAVAESLRGSVARVATAGDGELDAARITELAAGCDLLVSCWDRGFSAAHHWANRAALAHGSAALFGELMPTSSLAGPFFLPERSACWMCYRMRVIACEKNFAEAMAYEEHLDRQRTPALASRGVLPMLPSQLAATLALEALRHLARLGQPKLVDGMFEFEALSGDMQRHPVLVKPDCPTCGKKKRRASPPRDQVLNGSRTPGAPLPDLAARLVSPRTGIVCSLSAARRDPSEPPRPQVWRARISNHRFLTETDDLHSVCSGKGMDRTAAWTSCLGEAVERYSAGCWSRREVKMSRRSDLDGDALDPEELVLYRPEQYPGLPYAPYRQESELAWVHARSLIDDRRIWVPAIAVFMEYEVLSEDDFLFPVTSNGLAAGPTLADAILGAIYEVLERDAVLIAWLHRLPGRTYTAVEHPDADVRELAAAWRRRGVRLALVKVPSDHPVSVFLAIAFQEGGLGGPAAVVGMGADLDPPRAARQAALEVGQVRPTLRQRSRKESQARVETLAADPNRVKTLEDHALLYAHPSMAGAFDFLFGDAGEWQEPTEKRPAEEARTLLDHFAAVGQEVLWVDLTPPDLAPLGLFTARAILPGFQPIWFGRGERRLGGRRLWQLPARLGFGDSAAEPDALNPLPHPIA